MYNSPPFQSCQNPISYNIFTIPRPRWGFARRSFPSFPSSLARCPISGNSSELPCTSLFPGAWRRLGSVLNFPRGFLIIAAGIHSPSPPRGLPHSSSTFSSEVPPALLAPIKCGSRNHLWVMKHKNFPPTHPLFFCLSALKNHLWIPACIPSFCNYGNCHQRAEKWAWKIRNTWNLACNISVRA